MRRFSCVVAMVASVGCSSSLSEHSGGDKGKADFAYTSANVGHDKIDHPMVRGSQLGIHVRLHSDVATATIAADSDKPDVLAVEGWGRDAAIGEWRITIHALKAGEAKLRLLDERTKQPIDEKTIKIAEAAKIEAPGDIGLSVGGKRTFDAHVKDASGNDLYIASELEWTLDADVAEFQYFADPRGLVRSTGTRVTVRGNRPGPTTLHGRIGDVRVDVPVSVSK